MHACMSAHMQTYTHMHTYWKQTVGGMGTGIKLSISLSPKIVAGEQNFNVYNPHHSPNER